MAFQGVFSSFLITTQKKMETLNIHTEKLQEKFEGLSHQVDHLKNHEEVTSGQLLDCLAMISQIREDLQGSKLTP